MDISVQVVWSFALALFLTLVLPILLLLFLCLFKKISPLPMALGLLSFFISQILLRIPLLQFCAGQGWYQAGPRLLRTDFAGGHDPCEQPAVLRPAGHG